MSANRTARARGRVGRDVASYFALTFALSWLAWVPLLFLAVPEPLRGLLLVAGSFGPSAAALILLTKRSGWGGTRSELAPRVRWRLPWWLWVVAILGPATIILIAIAISALAGRPVVGWQDPSRLYLIIPVFAYVAILGGPLGEEIGWRGYALPRIQQGYGPVVAALLVGAVWALWHAPLFGIDGTVQRSVPTAAFAIQIITTSVIYTWLWNRTQSLPLVIAFHAAFNTSVGLLPILPDTAGSQTALWIALGMAAVVAAALIGVTRGQLALGAAGRQGGETRRPAPDGKGDTSP